MKKNNIYLATKLFSFFDRYASTNMYDAISKSKKYKDANIYLSFQNKKYCRLQRKIKVFAI